MAYFQQDYSTCVYRDSDSSNWLVTDLAKVTTILNLLGLHHYICVFAVLAHVLYTCLESVDSNGQHTSIMILCNTDIFWRFLTYKGSPDLKHICYLPTPKTFTETIVYDWTRYAKKCENVNLCFVGVAQDCLHFSSKFGYDSTSFHRAQAHGTIVLLVSKVYFLKC